MAANSGPDLVTEGCVLALDAADPVSYPGTGTIWRDLARGLTFNSQGTQTPFTTIKGVRCFGFNGSGHWICSVNSQLVDFGGDCTLIMWLWSSNLSTRATVFQKNGTIYQSYQQEISVTWEASQTLSYYSRYSSGGAGYDFAVGSTISINNWTMIAIKMSTGKTAAARTGFRSTNGSSWEANYTSNTSTAVTPAGDVVIGTGYAGSPVASGYIASCYAYTKMLSDSEIAQNFNAMRGRYGV